MHTHFAALFSPFYLRSYLGATLRGTFLPPHIKVQKHLYQPLVLRQNVLHYAYGIVIHKPENSTYEPMTYASNSLFQPVPHLLNFTE